MGTLTIECDTGKVSDGYHTFDELYAHRCWLFAALMRSHPDISWWALDHEDGSHIDDWLIAGMHLPTGDISYHLPMSMWLALHDNKIPFQQRAPHWDGHTAKDVVQRLAAWLGEW